MFFDGKFIRVSGNERVPAKSLSRNVDDVFLMIDTETGKVEYISPNVRRILGISPEAVQEDFHVLCSAGGYNCRSRLDDLMQMEQGTQQEWNRAFIHQETGEPRYIHVTGFINAVQGAKKCIVDLSDRTDEHQTTLAVEAALEVAENLRGLRRAMGSVKFEKQLIKQMKRTGTLAL